MKKKKKKKAKARGDSYTKQLDNINKVIVGATQAGVLIGVGASAVKAFKS